MSGLRLPCPDYNTCYTAQYKMLGAVLQPPSPALCSVPTVLTCIFHHDLFFAVSTGRQQFLCCSCVTLAVKPPSCQQDAKCCTVWIHSAVVCASGLQQGGDVNSELQWCLCLTGKIFVLRIAQEDGVSPGKFLYGVSLASSKAVWME